MTKLICAVIFTSLTLFSCSNPKPDEDKERITAVCDKFMKNFADGKISDAMQLLKQNSVLLNSAVDSLLITITDQFANIFPRYGRVISYEFITERKIKEFIAKRFYILKFEKYYLKFSFTIYKSSSGWAITGFEYNEDLIEVLY